MNDLAAEVLLLLLMVTTTLVPTVDCGSPEAVVNGKGGKTDHTA